MYIGNKLTLIVGVFVAVAFLLFDQVDASSLRKEVNDQQVRRSFLHRYILESYECISGCRYFDEVRYAIFDGIVEYLFQSTLKT